MFLEKEPRKDKAPRNTQKTYQKGGGMTKKGNVLYPCTVDGKAELYLIRQILDDDQFKRFVEDGDWYEHNKECKSGPNETIGLNYWKNRDYWRWDTRINIGYGNDVNTLNAINQLKTSAKFAIWFNILNNISVVVTTPVIPPHDDDFNNFAQI